MPLLSKLVTEATGLTEEVARTKLITIMRKDERYQDKRKHFDALGFAETYSDNSWGFIADVLGNDPQILIKLLKKRR